MVIEAVSSVRNNSVYNSVSFEGRKHNKENKNGLATLPSSLKAVPVAVLIAMSPMTETNAKDIMDQTQVEAVAEQTPQNNKSSLLIIEGGKKVYSKTYENPSGYYDFCNLEGFSIDNDDNTIEKIMLNFCKQDYHFGEIDDKGKYGVTGIDLETVLMLPSKVFKRKNPDGLDVYYISGKGLDVKTKLDGHKNVVDEKVSKVFDYREIPVKKEFAEHINWILGEL